MDFANDRHFFRVPAVISLLAGVWPIDSNSNRSRFAWKSIYSLGILVCLFTLDAFMNIRQLYLNWQYKNAFLTYIIDLSSNLYEISALLFMFAKRKKYCGFLSQLFSWNKEGLYHRQKSSSK